MKDSRIIILTLVCAIAFILSGISYEASAGICPTPPCVDSADIVDGQVKTVDLGAGAVTTGKLRNKAVTGAKVLDGSLTGADIKDGSLTELDFSTAHRVVVATSGGDYTTIGAALAAISPTATDPYVIDVMPGTYTENVTMKSYVHLRGAGREVTKIEAPAVSGPAAIDMSGLTYVAGSGFTIQGGNAAIVMSGNSVTIMGNTITGAFNGGILIYSGSPCTISRNLISGDNIGITNTTGSSCTISGNTITDNLI